jgi:hypothetical protein
MLELWSNTQFCCILGQNASNTCSPPGDSTCYPSAETFTRWPHRVQVPVNTLPLPHGQAATREVELGLAATAHRPWNLRLAAVPPVARSTEIAGLRRQKILATGVSYRPLGLLRDEYSSAEVACEGPGHVPDADVLRSPAAVSWRPISLLPEAAHLAGSVTPRGAVLTTRLSGTIVGVRATVRAWKRGAAFGRELALGFPSSFGIWVM